jgi:hypothetical protein
MIRLPILKDELAFLEKLPPDLEARPDLGHLANEIKARIERIRQEIRTLERNQNSKQPTSRKIVSKQFLR